MINYYQPEACAGFAEMIAREFPLLDLFQPSPEVAPWHVQAEIPCLDGGEPILLDFWPHKMKGGRHRTKTVVGLAALRDLILEAYREAQGDFEELELFE